MILIYSFFLDMHAYIIKEEFDRLHPWSTVTCTEVDIANITGAESGLEMNGAADATQLPFGHDGDSIA
jgi:hypothetical protein